VLDSHQKLIPGGKKNKKISNRRGQQVTASNVSDEHLGANPFLVLSTQNQYSEIIGIIFGVMFLSNPLGSPKPEKA